MNQFFPIQKSTLSAHAIGEHVAQAFDLAEPVRCRLLTQTVNDMYLIETLSTSFVYRIWRHAAKTLNSLETILEVQFQLSRQDLPVVCPIPLPSGNYLQTLNAPEGQRPAALFSFASGQPAGREITAAQSFVAGQLTANLHLLADTLAPSPDLLIHDVEFLLLEPYNVIRNCKATNEEQIESLEVIVSNLRQRVSNLDKTAPLFGICHGDVHGMNVLFDEEQVTLLDFDWLSYSWRAWDLAVFVWWIRGVEDEAKVKQAFLDGYHSVQPRAEAIVGSIPIFVPIRHLLLTSSIITNAEQGINVGRWIDKAFIEKRLRFIQTWM